MFAVADLIVVEVIERGLANLRAYPHHLDFILGRYEETSMMRKLHGDQWVRQARDLITQNRIQVRPAYVLDMNKLPAISVLAQYQEDLQVIGDYGSTCARQDAIAPIPLLRLQGVQWGDPELVVEEDALLVAGASTVEAVGYAGIWLRQGSFAAQVDRIVPGPTEDTLWLYTRAVLPRRSLAGWELVNMPSPIITEVHSSSNATTVSIDVISSGDIETHKLLGLVVRYCLRVGRQFMEVSGLQLSAASQGFPIIREEEQSIFQTNLQLSGKIWDSWIQSEERSPTYAFAVQAVPDPAGVLAGEQMVDVDE